MLQQREFNIESNLITALPEATFTVDGALPPDLLAMQPDSFRILSITSGAWTLADLLIGGRSQLRMGRPDEIGLEDFNRWTISDGFDTIKQGMRVTITAIYRGFAPSVVELRAIFVGQCVVHE